MKRITVEEYLEALKICKVYLKQIKEDISIVSEAASKYPFKDEPIKILGLSERAYNVVRQNEVFTIYQLLDKFNTVKSLMELKGLGDRSLREICSCVKDIYRIEIK